MYSTVLWESGQSIRFLSYALVYLNTAIAIAAHWSQKCCHSGTFSSMLFCTVNPLTILQKTTQNYGPVPSGYYTRVQLAS